MSEQIKECNSTLQPRDTIFEKRYMYTTCNLYCFNTVFEECKFPSSFGGAIFSAKPSFFEKCIFIYCSSRYGGAIYSTNQIHVNFSFFDFCQAQNGAGIYHIQLNDIVIQKSSFTRCFPTESATIYQFSNYSFYYFHTNISRINTQISEAGLHTYSPLVLIDYCIFDQMHSNNSPALNSLSSNLTIQNSCFSHLFSIFSPQFSSLINFETSITFQPSSNVLMINCYFSAIFSTPAIANLEYSNLICRSCCFCFSEKEIRSFGTITIDNCKYDSNCPYPEANLDLLQNLISMNNPTPIIWGKMSPQLILFCRIFCLCGGFTITFTIWQILLLIAKRNNMQKNV